VFLETFKSSYYASISLANWMSHLPPELLEAHVRMNPFDLASIPKTQIVIRPL